MTKSGIHKDAVSGIILIGMSLWIWWQAASFPQLGDGYPGPALFPQIIAIGLACAGLYIAVRSAGKTKSKRTAKTAFSPAGFVRLLIGLALAALYPILIEFTHFIPLMALLILFFGLLLKNAPWHSLLMSILSAALIYSLFTQLLHVPL